MRYDVAYLGKVRKVVDGEGNDVVSFRYDAMTGCPVRVRDRFGNDRGFVYDAEGRLVRETRRATGEREPEPVRVRSYDKSGNLAALSALDADGREANVVAFAYDAEHRPVRVVDGRGMTEIAYAKSGYPVSVRCESGTSVFVCYDAFNVPVSYTDAYGIETRIDYTSAGLVRRIVRLDGGETLASLEISYDGAGRPVATVDHRGVRRACARDTFGRVVKDLLPDGASVGYAYDAQGRLASVLDENGHTIAFDWTRLGLGRRTTAAGQLTDFVRDARGYVSEIVSSKDGKVGRRIRRTFDQFGRVTRIDYGGGEVETFAYDRWNRLARHTRGRKAETYRYDYFGRLVEKDEDGDTTVYVYDAWGRRTRRTLRRNGKVVSDETRAYDRHGRLVSISAEGQTVAYSYDAKGRVAVQTVCGRKIAFSYTKRGQLQSKTLLGTDGPVTELKYWYAKDGRIEACLANGELRKFFHDHRGRLVAVHDRAGNVLERYEYDPADNILAKTVGGERTTYVYDAANQLVSSTDAQGAVTQYAYDAAGRLVKEGARTYRYGYLDKVLAYSDGDKRYTYDYHVDGQLARATCGSAAKDAPPAEVEDFLWDGLALIRRGMCSFVNEPHVGGGAAVWSSDRGVLFNDKLGSTLGTQPESGVYAPVARTAFGDVSDVSAHFTGKPYIAGLGHAFLFRNYRANLGKWQTADPLGYPDGWNPLTYCGNRGTDVVDLLGMYVLTYSI